MPTIMSKMSHLTVIMQKKKADITTEMALEMIEYLDQTLTAADGVNSHLTPEELSTSALMVKKLKKFINKQGSEVDEMRGKIRRLEVSISKEREEREALQARYNTLEMNVVNTSALVKAFDLIKLFRVYHLSLNWDTVTNEYTNEKDKLENRLISVHQFDQIKAEFNAKYPMPSETPLLSDIIDVCHERHDEAHSGQIKTIVKQEKFLEDCAVYFQANPISESTQRVCIPILKKMDALKAAGKLRGL